MDSFLKALSVIFQIYQVFNIAYPLEAIQVWLFVEEYFYEIPCSAKKSNCLECLLQQIKN